ncbi:MAG TPA: DUF456 domain-containing protein [Bellilinea sp.]|nr:DUF456 domain-containing protein [Bellilinea sp.]
MNEPLSVAIPIIAGIFLAFGLITALLPVLPGLLIMWLTALIYGLVIGFDTAGIVIFAIITFLALFGSILDNVVMGGKAKIDGASWTAVFAALAGMLIGSVLFPPIGGFFLALLFIYGVEFSRVHDADKALKSTKGLLIGMGLASLVRFLFGLGIFAAWLIWVLIY